MPIINVPGVGQVNFPDSMSEKEIVEAIERDILKRKPEAKEATLKEKIADIPKALGRGAVGLLETAGIGASAALPEEYEKKARAGIESLAAPAREFLAPETPEVAETVSSKLATGLGSTLPFFLSAPLGLAGRVIAGGMGVSAGAGEARRGAEMAGATPEERRVATALGAPTGLLDIIAPNIGPLKSMLTTALARGGVEGATEAAQNVAQNLIARGVYDPKRDVLEGTAEEGAYGAGVGALASLILDMTLGRRAYQARQAPPSERPGAPETPEVLTVNAPRVPSGFTAEEAAGLRAEAEEMERARLSGIEEAARERMGEAQELARGLPGFAGTPGANVEMMEAMRQRQAQQAAMEQAQQAQAQKEAERIRLAQIKQIEESTFSSDPVADRLAKDRMLANLQPPTPAAPVAPTAVPEAPAMAGFAAPSQINAQMLEAARARQQQEQQAADKQRRDEIKRIESTTFSADPVQNEMAKRRALEAIGVAPQEPAVAEEPTYEQLQQRIAEAEAQDRKIRPLAERKAISRTRMAPEELEAMGIVPEERVKREAPKYKATEHPENIGFVGLDASNEPIVDLVTAGAKPFPTKRAAELGKRQRADMKIVKVPNGWVLSPKTEAEFAREGKTTVSEFQPGKPKGTPTAAHEFIVARGGLRKDQQANTSFPDENPRVGNRSLFSPTGGMTLSDAAELLREAGYIAEETETAAEAAITSSVRGNRIYTPEGYERAGEMQLESERTEEQRRQEREALFIPDADVFDYFYSDDFYRQPMDEVRRVAENRGVDFEGIAERLANEFPNATQEQYENAVRDAVGNEIRIRALPISEKLMAQEGQGNNATPEGEKIQKELAGKDINQVAQWTINNAPNNFQKLLAQKAKAMIDALQRRGVKMNFEIQGGNRRSPYLYRARGITSFIWDPQKGTQVDLLLNGEPVIKNQNGYASGMDYETVLHELLHVATRTSTKFLPTENQIRKDLVQLFNAVVSKYNADVKAGTLPPVLMKFYKNMNNVLESPDELITWGMTDRDFQNYLATINVGPKQTAFSKLVELIRELVGLAKPFETALEKLVRTTESILVMDLDVVNQSMYAQGYSFGPAPKPTTQMKQETLFATPKVLSVEGAVRQADKPQPTSIPQGLEQAGFIRLPVNSPRRYKRGSTSYGTWERDGVRVSLSSNVLAQERGAVQKYMAEDNEITVEALLVDPNKRGKGLAREALKLVTDLADNQGRTLYLEPVQIEKGAGLNKQQLTDFYARAGFEPTDGTGLVMVRKPILTANVPVISAQKATADVMQNPAFRSWFGNSKVVDAEGNPLVMYHATTADFDAFDTTRRAIAGEGSWFSASPMDSFASEEGGRIMPVYLSLQNPKVIDLARESDDVFKKKFIEQGYDGVVMRLDGKIVTAVAFQPEQIKSAIGNRGTYSPVISDILAAKEAPLQRTQQGQDAMDILAGMGREVKKPEDGYLKRVSGAWDNVRDNPKLVKEQSLGTFRRWADQFQTWAFSSDAALNNQIRREIMESNRGQEEKVGMLLNVSLSQTVNSDAIANLFLMKGNVRWDKELYKWVGEDDINNIGTLSAQLDEIASKHGLNKEEIELIAHTAFEAKRTRSLIRENQEIKAKAEAIRAEAARVRAKSPVAASELSDKASNLLQKRKVIHMTEDQIKAGMTQFELFPELKNLVDTWNGIRENGIRVLTETGLYSREEAENLLANADYVPFFREDQIEEGKGPKEFLRSLTVQADKRMKGSMKPVNDIFDNQVRWAQYAINRGVRNRSALALVDTAVEVGLAQQVKGPKDGDNVVRVWRNGKEEYYSMADPMFVTAFRGLESVAIPTVKFFSKFADILRQSVVLYPLFGVAQVPQDSFAAMFTSGLKPQYALRIPVLAVKEFVQTLRGKSTTHDILKNVGAAGVRDFTASVIRMDAEVLSGLKKDKSLWDRVKRLLGNVSMAADNAVRQAVFEAAEAQGLSRKEAIEKAFEIFNVRRRGSSQMLGLAGQVIPFFNAYLAAQNVAYRTLTFAGTSPTQREAAFKTLAATTGSVMALSILYAMMNADDEGYEKKATPTRDRLLIIPGTNGIGVPLRADAFILPKVLAEHVYHMLTENGMTDPGKFRESMKSLLANSIFSPTPVPQAVKPLAEAIMNYDFFQQKPLVGVFQQQKELGRQFEDSTSELSKLFGKTGYVSPIVSDHVIRGMFGSFGGLVLYMTNPILAAMSGTTRPDMSIQDAIATIPNASAFVSKEYELGLRKDFYALKEVTDRAASTLSDLKNRSPQEIGAYLEDPKIQQRIALSPTVNRIANQLTQIRKQINMITNIEDPSMSSAKKEEQIRQLRETELRLLKGIDLRRLREMAEV